ncbi:hypothetical protein Sta7437_4643 (plasmid) [Stanieria cyanosphaera PCC 7437]|uniref:Uncharacterized protein n=1 Tax=Stanieria cyanosphaera (strain ATCC 29371 / PCC 7437) TaxID=111780 RepID=K9XZU4_STAC7|nr:hypothetical protein [Stanieria cyanosphaera]AFZ38100.1 hypothetical protein Sta7437_4643 [Stanieria cyanosphaera PCC 7437]
MEKSVVWMGDSLKQVKSFPEEVKKDIDLIKKRYKTAVERSKEN